MSLDWDQVFAIGRELEMRRGGARAPDPVGEIARYGPRIQYPTPSLNRAPDRPGRGWFSDQVSVGGVPPGERLVVVLEPIRPVLVEWLRVQDETGSGALSFGLTVAPTPPGLTRVDALSVGGLPIEGRVLFGTADIDVPHRLRAGVDYYLPLWYAAGHSIVIGSRAGAELVNVELQWRELEP